MRLGRILWVVFESDPLQTIVLVLPAFRPIGNLLNRKSKLRQLPGRLLAGADQTIFCNNLSHYRYIPSPC